MGHNKVKRKEEEHRAGPFWSIKAKLIVSFCLIFVVVLVMIEVVDIMGVPFTPFRGRWGQQQAEVFSNLNLVADLKKERILSRLEEMRDDAHVWAENDLMKEQVDQLRAAIRDSTERGASGTELWGQVQKEEGYRMLKNFLHTVRSIYRVYDRIQIADAKTGTIFVSTEGADLGASAAGHSYFTGAVESGDFSMGIMEVDTPRHPAGCCISHAIKNKRGEVVAVLIIEFNAEDFINPMLRTGKGLGRSGEALLVNHNRRILTSLKYPLPDGTRPRPLEYEIKAQPATLAARGEEGIIESEDYRGVPVLAAYRNIPLTSEGGWGLVVKRDQAELFAPFRRGILASSLIALIGSVLIFMLTSIIAGSISYPLRRLTQMAKRVESGDLQARALITTSDEVGMLGTTFNSMVRRIENWHRELEEEVRARTAELVEANDELKKQINERQRAEEQVRLLGHAIRSVNECVGITDMNDRIIFVNEAFERTYGYTRDELLGRSILMLRPDNDPQESAEDILPETLKGGWQGELLNRRKDGSLFPIWLSTSVVRDEGDKPIALIGVSRDITEKKRAEAELQESEARFRRLVENAADPFFLIDLEGRIIDVSRCACESLGYAREELLTLNVSDIELDFSTERLMELWKQVRSGTTLIVEGTHQRKDGTTFPVEVHVGSVESDGRRLILALSRDVTERKRADERLKASLKEKEVLLQEIHHRVKNNMQVISSLLNLQAGYIEDSGAREVFTESQNRIRSMALVHEKLYQSKDLARIDFVDYVRTLTTHLYRSYGASTNTIHLRIDVAGIYLGVDTAIPCGLIINELVSNSLKYAFPDGRTGEIEIRLSPISEDKVTLIVRDDGVGFPEDVDFRHTTSLGLQLVVTLVDQLDGTIELDRSSGTKFEMTFPREA